MPFFDKYWWLWLIGAPLAVSLAVVVPLSYLSHQLPLDHDLAYSPLVDVLVASGLAGVFLIASVVAAREGFVARRRTYQRWAAIRAGDTRIPMAVPLQFAPEEHSDGLSGPLELRWPALTSRSRVRARIRVALGMGVPVLMALCTVVLVMLAPKGTEPVLALGGAYSGCTAAIRTWRRGMDKSYVPERMRVDDTGITWQPLLGARREIRWGEMRLLEVAKPGDSARRFTLYSERAAIWWTDDYSTSPPDQPIYAILDMLRSRAGLVPCTFDKRLMSKQDRASTLTVQAIQDVAGTHQPEVTYH